MLNGVVVQTIAGQKYARTSLGTIVARAYLIELGNCAPRIFHFSKFQIRLSQQIEVLRAVWMLLDLFHKFGLIELSPGLGSEIGAVVQVFKEVLIGIRPRRRIFGEGLEDAQVPLRSLGLVEAALDH